MLEAFGAFASWPPPWPSPGPAGGLQRPPDTQLKVAMIFGHCVSCLRHDGNYLLLQRELPGTLTNFKRVTVTISPRCHGKKLVNNIYYTVWRVILFYGDLMVKSIWRLFGNFMAHSLQLKF